MSDEEPKEEVEEITETVEPIEVKTYKEVQKEYKGKTKMGRFVPGSAGKQVINAKTGIQWLQQNTIPKHTGNIAVWFAAFNKYFSWEEFVKLVVRKKKELDEADKAAQNAN